MLARTRNMLWVIDHLRIKQLRKANLGEITAAVIHPVDTHRAELELQQYGVRFESVSSFDPLPWERSTYCKSEPAAPNPEKARGESQSKRSRERERDTTVWKKGGGERGDGPRDSLQLSLSPPPSLSSKPFPSSPSRSRPPVTAATARARECATAVRAQPANVMRAPRLARCPG